MKNIFRNTRLCAFIPVLIILLMGCVPTIAPDGSAKSNTSAYELDIKRKVLDSGLTVLHVQRDNLPMLRMTLLVKAGSVNEPDGKAGLASLTASLLSEGTKSRTSTQLSREIEFIGASLGASASADFSTLSLSILTKDMDKGFELFSDVLLNPTFPIAQLKRKRTERLGALKQRREDPGYLAAVEFKKLTFGKNPYGRLTSGDESTLPSITRADIKNFYNKSYRPGSAVLSVVGKINPQELDALITKYLAAWQPLTDTSSFATVATPAPLFRLSTIDKQLTQSTIRMGHIGVERAHPDYYALQVMNYVLGGGGFSSRLMDRLRAQLGLTYGIYSSFSAYKDAGSFIINIQTKNETAVQAIKEIRSQVHSMIEQGITPEELSDAQAYLTGSFPRRISTMSSISSFLASVEFYGLGLDYPTTYAAKINALTTQDILRVARKHIHEDRMNLVVVGDLDKAGLIGNTPNLNPDTLR